MLRISATAAPADAGPRWLTAAFKPLGIDVQVRPYKPAMGIAARFMAQKAAAAADKDLPEFSTDGILNEAYSVAIAQQAIIGWKGVGASAADGETASDDELPVTQENIAAAMADMAFYDAFDEAYVRPTLVSRTDAKNA